MGFEGRVAIVTGGTRGIGAAISERLLSVGASVTAVYASDDAAADEFANSMESKPGTLRLRKTDIGDPANCRAVVADVVRAAGRFGRIVNISSVTAVMGSPVAAGYGAAKAGLHGLSRSLARAVARKGITVNVIVPGVFETDMTKAMDPDAQTAIAKMIPAGRRGEPSELAHAVMFLLDERASYVTGSVITVDGGLSMGG